MRRFLANREADNSECSIHGPGVVSISAISPQQLFPVSISVLLDAVCLPYHVRLWPVLENKCVRAWSRRVPDMCLLLV